MNSSRGERASVVSADSPGETALRSDPLAWIDDELSALDQRGLLRSRITRGGTSGTTIEVEGRQLVNLGSNDYLGLAADPRIRAAMEQAVTVAGCGSGASPLLAGYTHQHAALERRLAQFVDAEAALVFSSGYAANVGAVTALVERGDAVFSDAYNHASLIDGCRLSRADIYVYPHVDCDALESQLRRAHAARRRLIVTDSLFSMHGDFAPLVRLAKLAERYDAMLLVDEAHATGVYGAQGRGLAEQLGVAQRVDVHVGTLSKALASSGGFVAGRRSVVEWLVNRARPYIFSTASPAPVAAAAHAALDLVEQEPQRRRQLLERAAALRAMLVAQGWCVGTSTSQILPVEIGDERTAVTLAARLRKAGFYVPAIRPPSVPSGQARLRVAVSYGHTANALAALAATLGPAPSKIT